MAEKNMKPITLNINGVSKSFAKVDSDEVTHALDSVNLELKSGEFVCIVGPSGCGKSTLLRMIGGLIPPTTGSLKIDGEVIDNPDPDRGMMFQKPTLFPWLTVRDNIAFSARMRKINNKDSVEEIIETIGLKDFADVYPAQLSGGMAQRVALARTIINRPKILLLDEPLGALDAFTRMNMQDEILNAWQDSQQLGIMVTHDIEEAVYMGTRVIVMESNPGRIIADIKIEDDYPRDRASKSFVSYRNEIMAKLNIGG